MKFVAASLIGMFLSGCAGAGYSRGAAVPLNPRQQSFAIANASSAGPYLYGSTYLSPALSIYSESTNSFVQQVQEAGSSNAILNSIALSPDGTKLYVSQWSNGSAAPQQISILSTATNQFTGAMAVPMRYARFFSLTPNASGSIVYAYLLTNTSEYDILGFFDTSSHSLTGTLQMPSYYTHAPALDPRNGLIYAAGYRNGPQANTSYAYVDVVNPSTRKVTKSFSLGGNTSDAAGAAFDSTGDHLYVHYNNLYIANTNPNQIRILNPSTGARQGTIFLPTANYGVTGTFPDMLVSSRDRLYINNGNTLYVYDLATRAQVAAIPIPSTVSDSGMAFNASQSTIYLSARQYVYVIDTTSNTITGSFTTAPASPQNTQVWLAAQ